jgi:hypothetical protein
MNSMLKSAAWPAVDIKALDECYLVRATYPSGETTDYYAYLQDGKAVMQRGLDGYYSRIDDGLYGQLVELAQRTGAVDDVDLQERFTTLSIDRTSLKDCISGAIFSYNANQYHNGDLAVEAHTVLKVVENDSSTTVYAMALPRKR